MFTVDFVGLIYFHVCHEGAKRVLLPDGRRGDFGTMPHLPRLYVEERIIDKQLTDWRMGTPMPIPSPNGAYVRFPLDCDRAEITFSFDISGHVDVGNLPCALQSLDELTNHHFTVDLKNGKTVAELSVGGGTLAVGPIGGDPPQGFVRWERSDVSERVTISVTPGGAAATHEKSTIVLDAHLTRSTYPLELVIANTMESPDPSMTGPPHARLYANVRIPRKTDGLDADVGVKGQPAAIDLRHPYLKDIKTIGPDTPGPGCTPQCC